MELKAGQEIKAYGHEWIVLDVSGVDSALCLMKEVMAVMPMSKAGDCHNYCDSDIASYLSPEYISLGYKGVESRTCTLDMTADDGTGWKESSAAFSGLFLLTKDMYKRYRKHIPLFWNTPIWLATRWSYEAMSSFCCAGTDGIIFRGLSIHMNGVTPAIIFKKEGLLKHLRHLKEKSKSEEWGCTYLDLMKRTEDLDKLEDLFSEAVKGVTLLYRRKRRRESMTDENAYDLGFEITHKVEETKEDFIFKTILRYAEKDTVASLIPISKQIIKRALICFRREHPDEYNRLLMESNERMEVKDESEEA